MLLKVTENDHISRFARITDKAAFFPVVLPVLEALGEPNPDFTTTTTKLRLNRG